MYIYRYIFKFLLDVAITNSYILFKNFVPATGEARQSYKQFRLKLAMELIADYNSRQRYGMPKPTYELAKAKSMTPTKRKRSDEGNGHYPTRNNKVKCWYCWNVNRERHETRLKCKACDIPLCVYGHNNDDKSCFEKYHTDVHLYVIVCKSLLYTLLTR